MIFLLSNKNIKIKWKLGKMRTNRSLAQRYCIFLDVKNSSFLKKNEFGTYVYRPDILDKVHPMDESP